MGDNDRVNLQRMLSAIKKLRQMAAYVSSEENVLARKVLRHLDEMERDIRQAISS